jgi:ATP-dependent Lhr-like helicase
VQRPDASTTPGDSPHPVHRLQSLFEPYVRDRFTDTFGHPSPPQAASWPRIAGGKDTLMFSPTGSGKTPGAFLWCTNDLFRMGSQEALDDGVRMVYVSPLKALNNDCMSTSEQSHFC